MSENFRKSLERRKYDAIAAVGGQTGLIRIGESELKKLKQLALNAQKDREYIKKRNLLWRELQELGFKEGFMLQIRDENGKNLISGTISGFNENDGMINLKMGRSTNLLSGESDIITRIRVSRLANLLSKEADRDAEK